MHGDIIAYFSGKKIDPRKRVREAPSGARAEEARRGEPRRIGRRAELDPLVDRIARGRGRVPAHEGRNLDPVDPDANADALGVREDRRAGDDRAHVPGVQRRPRPTDDGAVDVARVQIDVARTHGNRERKRAGVRVVGSVVPRPRLGRSATRTPPGCGDVGRPDVDTARGRHRHGAAVDGNPAIAPAATSVGDTRVRTAVATRIGRTRVGRTGIATRIHRDEGIAACIDRRNERIRSGVDRRRTGVRASVHRDEGVGRHEGIRRDERIDRNEGVDRSRCIRTRIGHAHAGVGHARVGHHAHLEAREERPAVATGAPVAERLHTRVVTRGAADDGELALDPHAGAIEHVRDHRRATHADRLADAIPDGRIAHLDTCSSGDAARIRAAAHRTVRAERGGSGIAAGGTGVGRSHAAIRTRVGGRRTCVRAAIDRAHAAVVGTAVRDRRTAVHRGRAGVGDADVGTAAVGPLERTTGGAVARQAVLHPVGDAGRAARERGATIRARPREGRARHRGAPGEGEGEGHAEGGHQGGERDVALHGNTSCVVRGTFGPATALIRAV